MAQIDTMVPWDEDKRNEAATELCDCLEAKTYTRKKGQKERARKVIEKQFGQQAQECEIDEASIDLLNAIVELVVEEKICSASVDIGDGLKAKISITSKDFVKVERTKTEKATQET